MNSDISKLASSKQLPDVSSKKIFVVHGHDHALKDNVEAFLRRHGLEPIILHQQADQGQTLIEKVERHSDVSYAMVLFTPDDRGADRADAESIPSKLNPRARQNVVLELGYFVGMLGRSKVCCLRKGNVEIPTDFHGVLYKSINQRIEEIEADVLRELHAAGLTPSP